MREIERRRSLRHKVQIDVTIRKKGERIPARIINVGRGGISVISDKPIFPGEKVDIIVDCIGKFDIRGSAIWGQLTSQWGFRQYRIGIEPDEALAPEDLWKAVVSETGDG